MDTQNTRQNYEKLRRDGKVAVLYSPGYGAGWSTWCDYEGMVFDADIAKAVLAGKHEDAGKIAAVKYPDAYLGGLSDLQVEWVKEGEQFEITEYDGSESVRVIGECEFYVA